MEITPADVSIRELEARWGLSRNGLKARARALGIELIRVSSTLTTWPGAYLELGEALHRHLSSGQPMATFPGIRPAGTASTETALPASRFDSADSEDAALVPSAPAAVTAPEPQAITTHPVAQQLGAPELVAVLERLVPPPDPLRRARGLAEAADAGLVLTNEELAALLGQGVTGWRDGQEAYGYRFRRHKPGRSVLWTLERAISAGTSTALMAATPERTPGFRIDPPIEARATVLSRIELPFC